jgi:hypothetical protein
MSQLPEMVEDDASGRLSKSKKLLATILATFALAAGFPVQADVDMVNYRTALTKPVVPEPEFLNLIHELNQQRLRELREDTFKEIEEMTVTALDLSKILTRNVLVYSMQVGLEGKVLIHVYDEDTNTWKYTNTDPRTR